MLVIHWAKHNKTGSILKTGLRVSSRKYSWRGSRLSKPTPQGVYVFPYTRSRYARGLWRRILKEGALDRGNYNGFVFRLCETDFPLRAGYWDHLHESPEEYLIRSMRELTQRYGHLLDDKDQGQALSNSVIEIILPRRIPPERIIRVLRDREPRARESARD